MRTLEIDIICPFYAISTQATVLVEIGEVVDVGRFLILIKVSSHGVIYVVTHVSGVKGYGILDGYAALIELICELESGDSTTETVAYNRDFPTCFLVKTLSTFGSG